VKAKVIESAEEGKLGAQANLSASLGTLVDRYETLSEVLIGSHNESRLVRGPLRLVVNMDRHLRLRHNHVALRHDWPR